MRPRWVIPRFPPSPTTFTAQLAAVDADGVVGLVPPTSALLSAVALMYVPMPPFHSRSTGAARMLRISSAGVSASISSAES